MVKNLFCYGLYPVFILSSLWGNRYFKKRVRLVILLEIQLYPFVTLCILNSKQTFFFFFFCGELCSKTEASLLWEQKPRGPNSSQTQSRQSGILIFSHAMQEEELCMLLNTARTFFCHPEQSLSLSSILQKSHFTAMQKTNTFMLWCIKLGRNSAFWNSGLWAIGI